MPSFSINGNRFWLVVILFALHVFGKILLRKFRQNINAGHTSAARCWIIGHPMKQASGACPTREQRAAYLSPSAQAMHLLNSAWRLSFFGFSLAAIALHPKTFFWPFKRHFSPSPAFLALSNLLVTVRSQPSGTWSVIGVSAVTAYSTAPNDALGRLPGENSISSSHLSVVIIRIFPL